MPQTRIRFRWTLRNGSTRMEMVMVTTEMSFPILHPNGPTPMETGLATTPIQTLTTTES